MCKPRVVLVFAALLVGCSGTTTSAAQTPASPTPTPQARYSTVVDLRDAAVKAGYSCPDWKQTDQVTLALQSGSCTDGDVFSIYQTSDDVSQVIQDLKEFGEIHLLVGENWLINSDGTSVSLLSKKIGGTVVDQND